MIPTITYETIVNIVKNYAKTNCINIANFGGLPACYKSGFSLIVGSRSANYIGEGGNVSGINNPIVQVGTDTVDTDMTNFLTKIGISTTTVTYPIDDANLTNFLMDMVAFACTKIGVAVSQGGTGASNDRRMVYMNGNTDYGTTYTIYPKAAGQGQGYTYNGATLKSLTDGFFAQVKKGIRVAPITFTFSCY